MRGKESTAVLVVIFLALGALGYLVFAVMGKLQALQTELAANNTAPVDVSQWETYSNDTYGFEIEYPPTWQLSTDGLTGATPFIEIGDPLSGAQDYDMQIFIENNTSSLSSGSYAHSVIDAAKAVDAENAQNTKNGRAPTTAPTYDKTYILTVGSYPAYELYDDFEFDHKAERVYVAHGDEVLRFDFPVAEENPNLWLPVANNGVAHEIMNTLVFTN